MKFWGDQIWYINKHKMMELVCKIIIVAILVPTLMAQIIPFDTHAIEKTFQARRPTVFLFTSDNEESDEAKQVFQELDETKVDAILAISDANDGHKLFRRLTRYLGLDPDITPQILFLGEQQEKYIYEDDITLEGLKAFVKKVLGGSLQPVVKSALAPEHNDGFVKVAVGATFKQMVEESEKQSLVEFYTPWCQQCKAMASDYEQAARRLAGNPNIQFVKIDLTENEVVGVEIEGFPTIKFYQKDKNKGPVKYTGGLTPEQIIDWLRRHVHYPWVEPSDQKASSQL